MENEQTKYPLILAIAPSTNGFGFAVMEGQGTLDDWGTKRSRGEKNREAVRQAEKLMEKYAPQVIALEDVWAEGSRRHARIRRLTKMIQALAKKRRIKVALFSRKRVMDTFIPGGKGTRNELAQAVARKFEDELSAVLPPERKFYETENYRTDIFFAVALALMLRKVK